MKKWMRRMALTLAGALLAGSLAVGAVAEEKDAEIAQLKAQLAQMQETARWNGQRCDEEATAAGEAQRRAEAAEAEVIQLKAKLCDLLVAGKGATV